MDATAEDDDSVVGDECHIAAKSPGGPRFDPTIPNENIDLYSNLILLCKIHHKLVDDQPNTYAINELKKMKQNHELWVREALQSASEDRQHLHIAPRVRNGKDILSFVIEADAYDFSHDELVTEEELELVSWLMQYLQDWIDIGPVAESGDRVRAGFQLSQHIRELEELGFGVFGFSETRPFRMGDKKVPISVAVVRVARLSSPSEIEVPQKRAAETNLMLAFHNWWGSISDYKRSGVEMTGSASEAELMPSNSDMGIQLGRFEIAKIKTWPYLSRETKRIARQTEETFLGFMAKVYAGMYNHELYGDLVPDEVMRNRTIKEMILDHKHTCTFAECEQAYEMLQSHLEKDR